MADFHLVGNVLADCAVVIVQVEQEVAGRFDLQRAECHGLRRLDVLDGQMLALRDDVLHLVELQAVEHRLHPIHYIIYKAFREDSNEQSRHQTRQPAALPGHRDVTLAAMLPLPYLRSDEESVERLEERVLQAFEPSLPGYLVEGEYVDEDALVHLDVPERGFREAGAIHTDLHEEERRVRLRVGCLQEEAVAKLLGSDFSKTLIVGTHHANVDVVVPRQYLLPEVRTDSRPARHEVADAMLPADAVHLGKRRVERFLKLLKFLLLVIHLLVLVSSPLGELEGGNLLRAQGIHVFHLAGPFPVVSLGTEIVYHTHDDSLLGAWHDGASELPLPVMRQHAMDDSLRLLLVHSLVVEDIIQPVSADVDVSEQIHVWQRLALLAVFAHLAAVVEEYRKDAMFHFHLIWQTGIKSLEHPQHLVRMVQQPAGIGVMHRCGSRIDAERLVKTCGKFLDDAH